MWISTVVFCDFNLFKLCHSKLLIHNSSYLSATSTSSTRDSKNLRSFWCFVSPTCWLQQFLILHIAPLQLDRAAICAHAYWSIRYRRSVLPNTLAKRFQFVLVGIDLLSFVHYFGALCQLASFVAILPLSYPAPFYFKRMHFFLMKYHVAGWCRAIWLSDDGNL